MKAAVEVKVGMEAILVMMLKLMLLLPLLKVVLLLLSNGEPCSARPEPRIALTVDLGVAAVGVVVVGG